jgi:hypothetical protein
MSIDDLKWCISLTFLLILKIKLFLRYIMLFYNYFYSISFLLNAVHWHKYATHCRLCFKINFCWHILQVNFATKHAWGHCLSVYLWDMNHYIIFSTLVLSHTKKELAYFWICSSTWHFFTQIGLLNLYYTLKQIF